MSNKSSDTLRIEWSVEILQDVKTLGRDKPLGDKWPHLVMVIDALNRVLQPNLPEQAAQPDCRTCNNLDSCSEDAKWMRNYCTHGDKYQPAPAVVLWRTEP